MSKGRPNAVSALPVSVNRVIPRTPIGLNEPGSEFWNHTFRHAHWLDADADFYVVYSAAKVVDEIFQARAEIERSGRYQILPNGVSARSAAAIDLEHLQVSFNSFLAALGLTPTDRSKMGVAPKEESDVFAELERRRIERISRNDPR
jgi:hypothetical protein